MGQQRIIQTFFSKDDSIDTINSWDSLVTVSLATALSSEYGIELDIDQLKSSVKV